MNRYRHSRTAAIAQGGIVGLVNEERWVTAQEPSFPHPLCVSNPPKQPNRQDSVETNPICRSRAPMKPRRQESVEALTVSSAHTRYPRRRPPMKPSRQESVETLTTPSAHGPDSRYPSRRRLSIEEPAPEDQRVRKHSYDLSSCLDMLSINEEFSWDSDSGSEHSNPKDTQPCPTGEQESSASANGHPKPTDGSTRRDSRDLSPLRPVRQRSTA